MKQFLLLSAIIIASLSVIAQNHPPVAVNDTVHIFYSDINQGNPGDTTEFRLTTNVRYNDTDPDGDNLSISSATILGSSLNFVTGQLVNNHLIFIDYHVINEFTGLDSMQYIISDDGNPSMSDTGILYIVAQQKEYAFLDANNLKTLISPMSLFANRSIPHFEAPIGSGATTIFAANLWIAGKSNNSAYSSSKTFGWTWPIESKASNSGPISNSSSQLVEYDQKWDRVWKVRQYEVDFHLANWNSANYNPPPVFLTWPAHGDTTLGEGYYLAPFFDSDGDGHYNPYAGDYPAIKGDQSIFFIYNDGGSTVNLNPMKSEVHGLAYAFHCQDSAVHNTIFVDYKIINRSNNTYDSTHVGMWADFDLGNSQDDYLQCDVDRGLFYAFNGDDFDEDNAGRPGFGAHTPAQGILILKGTPQDADGQDNSWGVGATGTINGTGFDDGIVDNESWGLEHFISYHNQQGATGTPINDGDYYNFLSGKWRDGTTLYYGGTGYPNSSGTTNVPAKYMFPGTSDSTNYGSNGVSMPTWTEVTAGNTPNDRRGTGSSGPVTFAPGDEIELTYAFVFGRDYVNTGAQAGVNNMLERADSIRSYYDQGMLTACGFPVSVNEPVEIDSEISVYPNPAKSTVNIRQDQAEHIQIEVIDVTGKVVLETSSSNQLTQIVISGLTNGIYLIRIESNDKSNVFKIVKK